VLTILVVVLSIAGIFLEGLPIFTIFLPLVVPIANVYHWNMVWFGIVMCYMVMIGMFTPFMSVILMIAARIANTTIESTTKWVSWMFVSMLTTLVAIVAFPQIVLWLPDMLQR
jgi:TRAP-type C4-dicarboxylate transport system permease large subunit